MAHDDELKRILSIDKYMEVRKNTLISNKAKLEIAALIIIKLQEDYQNFIPNNGEETPSYEAIEKALDTAKNSLREAFELNHKMQQYYDERLKQTSEVFRKAI